MKKALNNFSQKSLSKIKINRNSLSKVAFAASCIVISNIALAVDCNLDIDTVGENNNPLKPTYTPYYKYSGDLTGQSNFVIAARVIEPGKAELWGAWPEGFVSEKIVPAYNHIFAKASNVTNGLRKLWRLTAHADDEHKKTLVTALRKELLDLVGKYDTKEVTDDITKETKVFYEYPTSVISAPDVKIRTLNSLIHRYLGSAECLPVGVKENPVKCVMLKVSKDGDEKEISLSSNPLTEADEKFCKTKLHTQHALFMWNPAFAYYSPHVVDKSWDPQNSFDSWIYNFTQTQAEKDAISSTNEYLLTEPEENEGNGNLAVEHIVNIINSQLGGDKHPFAVRLMNPTEWKYEFNNNKAAGEREKGWCPIKLNGNCFSRPNNI